MSADLRAAVARWLRRLACVVDGGHVWHHGYVGNVPVVECTSCDIEKLDWPRIHSERARGVVIHDEWIEEAGYELAAR